MKKRLYLNLSLIAVLALLLCACTAGVIDNTPETTAVPTVTEAAATVPPTQVPQTTAPAHSALYLPRYTCEQILTYFEEIVLHMEYTNGTGDSSLVQKWLEPIHYRIEGEATREDLQVLADFFGQLNEIEGFPGIREADEWETPNLTLHFLEPEPFDDLFSGILQGEEAFGAVQFWYYTDTNEIYTADVGYRTDIEQTERSSILIEEIVNMLGISDTQLREDSIVYQYSDDNLAPSDVDWVILKLLYNPLIRCGMGLEECRTVIAQLYY